MPRSTRKILLGDVGEIGCVGVAEAEFVDAESFDAEFEGGRGDADFFGGAFCSGDLAARGFQRLLDRGAFFDGVVGFILNGSVRGG